LCRTDTVTPGARNLVRKNPNPRTDGFAVQNPGETRGCSAPPADAGDYGEEIEVRVAARILMLPFTNISHKMRGFPNCPTAAGVVARSSSDSGTPRGFWLAATMTVYWVDDCRSRVAFEDNFGTTALGSMSNGVFNRRQRPTSERAGFDCPINSHARANSGAPAPVDNRLKI
jgi:hypothetical protein